MGVFHTAVKRIHQADLDETEREARKDRTGLLPPEPRINLAKWVGAVADGADNRSPSSRHVLILGGLLVGLGSLEGESVDTTTLLMLQQAFVHAVGRSLEDPADNDLGRRSLVLALNHSFPYLSDSARSQLHFDGLLPILSRVALDSPEGLNGGYFLGAIDIDVQQSDKAQFTWSPSSRSYHQLQSMLSSPIISSIGPLSRLISSAVEHAADSRLVASMVDETADFCANLHKQWRLNKLSEVDVSEEQKFLSLETTQKTLPELWRLLRSTLFALVIVLRSAVGRLLADRYLASDILAPHIATRILRSLHDLNFIFSRISNSAFSQYTFTHLTCVDILNTYPDWALHFLQSIVPSESGNIPQHPLDRSSDLYFLNTAEHFTLCITSADAEQLLIRSALPYLTSEPTPQLVPIFEAAHAVMLAVFAAPQNAELANRQLPFYVDVLFKAFPQNLSARQFRLAMRNLVKVVSPPGQVAMEHPMLAAVLLDLLHHRAENASNLPIPPRPDQPANATELQGPLSEQLVLIMALVDVLPFVEIRLLREWLPLIPDLFSKVEDAAHGEQCVRHLWETMVNGSMDPERSQECVAWWSTGGGREACLFGPRGVQEQLSMSGALPNAARLRASSTISAG